jgi:Protein of unknown function (DUF3891)
MLLRKDGPGVIAIPSHAWLSGQMARAWGNAHFTAPAPHEEVRLAGKQHDIAWLSSEIAPAFDAGTGLSQEFFKVPPKLHIALWRDHVGITELPLESPPLVAFGRQEEAKRWTTIKMAASTA